MIADEQLDWQTHIAFQRATIGGVAGQEIYFHNAALFQHSLCVSDALRDEFTLLVSTSEGLQSGRAKRFLLRGAARRLQIIYFALRNIISIAPTDREKTLNFEESIQLTKEINVVYSQIGGVLDNFAWCMLSESGIHEPKSKTHVAIFHSFYIKILDFFKIREEIYSYKPWFDDYWIRRNPSVHQIPFYVPQHVLRASEEEAYIKTQSEWVAAVNRLAFEEADEKMKHLHSMGRFVPLMTHDETAEMYRIYPVLPQDIGQIVRISRCLRRAIAKKR